MKRQGPGRPKKEPTQVIGFRVRKKRAKKLKPKIEAVITEDNKANP